MKTLKNLFGVMIFGLMALMLSAFSGVHPGVVGTGLYVASFMPKPQGSLMIGLDVEIWKPWIVEQLFANNDFLSLARNADEYVLNGKVVHIPNAGAGSRVKKNRGSLPAIVTRRRDIDVTYALDEFTSDPRLLESADKILSYDKMNSVMGQDMRVIKQLVAESMLYNWRPATSKIVATTGASVPAHIANSTGNRKTFKLDNLDEASAIMTDDDVPEGDRYALMSARMHQQLVKQLSVGDYKDFSRAYDEKKGIVGELFGFKFIKRSKSLRADNANGFYDPDPEIFVPANTDNDVVLCWHIDAVERAVGTTEIFENKADATYYGDIYSLLLRAGGRRLRDDNKGVIGIVQTNV